MKKIIFILILAMVTLSAADASSFKHKKHYSHVTISMQRFYDELAPFGDWIYSPEYGYIWRPYFDYPQAFRPYSSGGHWVYTEYGWTWASDYPWGWATFHYGRWDYDHYLGWVWIPGYEWAPAWVSWGRYDDYWGWAPLGPRIDVDINFGWHAPDIWWTFVPFRHFCSPNWNRYIYDRPVYINHITQINNIYYGNGDQRKYGNGKGNWFNGPRVSDVERLGSARVRQMQVLDADRPTKSGIRGNAIEVYRPGVDGSRSDVRPVEYRNVENMRTGERLQTQSARTNNPGEYRTRETRIETRDARTTPVDRSTYDRGSNRSDSRYITQSPEKRNTPSEVKSSREIPSTGRQSVEVNENRNTQPRNGAVTRETNPAPRRETPANSASERRNENHGSVVRQSTPARSQASERINAESRSERPAAAARPQPVQSEKNISNGRTEAKRSEPARRSDDRKTDNNNKENRSEKSTPAGRPGR